VSACRRFWKMLEIGQFWPFGGPPGGAGRRRRLGRAAQLPVPPTPTPPTRGAAGAWGSFATSACAWQCILTPRICRRANGCGASPPPRPSAAGGRRRKNRTKRRSPRMMRKLRRWARYTRSATMCNREGRRARGRSRWGHRCRLQSAISEHWRAKVSRRGGGGGGGGGALFGGGVEEAWGAADLCRSSTSKREQACGVATSADPHHLLYLGKRHRVPLHLRYISGVAEEYLPRAPSPWPPRAPAALRRARPEYPPPTT